MLRAQRTKRTSLTLLLIAFTVPQLAQATSHTINNDGTNAIKSFIENTALWNPGDTLVLSGTIPYILSNTVEIPQEIILIGDPQMAQKPVVYFYDNGFRPMIGGINITFKGFRAIGIEPMDSTEQSRAKALLRFDHAEWSTFGDIVIEDMHIKAFRQITEFYRNQYGAYESFKLHNCIVHDIAGETILDFRKASVKQVTITQNSFSDVEHGFFGELYYQDNGNLPDQERYVEQHVLIDHNTFYNVVGGFNRSLIQNNAGIDGSVSLTFSNNVVSTLFYDDEARPFRINTLAGDFTFSNNVFHDFNSSYENGFFNLERLSTQDNVTVTDAENIDPVFYDVTGNGPYDLTISHPAFKTRSTTGGLIGDLRWQTGPQNTLHKIANTADDVLKAFIENTTLWTPGDTILLGEASTYVVSAATDIKQEVVIMGDPSLPQRPMVRFDDNGFVISEDMINVNMMGFRATGVEPGENPTVAESFIRSTVPEDSRSHGIILESLDIENFGQLIQLDRSLYGLLSIRDCYVRNLVNDYAIATNLSSIAETTITNSTFTDLAEGFLSLSDLRSGASFSEQQVFIDRNTFFNVVGNNGGSFVEANVTDGSIAFTFSNNIVSELYDPENAQPFLINEQAGDFQFQNSAFHNFTSTIQSGNFNLETIAEQSKVTTTNINAASPDFLSTTPEGYNFTISNLVYLNASTTNDWVGDPRWIPEAASTVHYIFDNDNNDLEVFIEDITLWTPGDTIILAESATYEVANSIEIKQEVVIMANPNLADKPVIQFMENGFYLTTDQVNIDLIGFAAEGTSDPETSLLRFDQPEWSEFQHVTLQSLNIKKLGTIVSLYENQYGHYESLKIDDCQVQDITGSMAIASNFASVKDLQVTNSTFINVAQGFLGPLYFQDASNSPAQEAQIAQEVLIDHNTFFNVTGLNQSSFIDHPAGSDGSIDFTFSNSIVTNLYDDSNAVPFDINEAAGEYLFTNSLFYAFESGDNSLQTLSSQSNVTVQSIDYNYPQFKDSSIYDFRLWEYEPVRTAGTDGKEIGDPRWIPEVYPVSASTIHRIPNTKIDTLRSIIENTVIWDPGDTILLISEGEYIETGTIKINQSLVIMADTSLASKPIIRFYSNGFQVTSDSVSVHITGVDFNGFNGDRSDRAPFIVRYNAGSGSYQQNLIIEDSNADGFRGGIDLDVGKHGIYENIEVNNVLWNNFDGEYCIDPNLNFTKSLTVTNSTFSKVTYGFLKNPGFANEENNQTTVSQSILVDHNTFYKVGGNNNSFIQINDPTDNSVNMIFSNNIVSTLYQQDNARPFRINESAGDLMFQNSVMHNLDVPGSPLNFDEALVLSNVNEEHLIYDDPEYADPDAVDFTIPNTSALLTSGTDGNAIGDPRWAPEPGDVTPSLSTESLEQMMVYPNPASDFLMFSISETIKVSIRDMSGRLVSQSEISSGQQLDIRMLNSGTYLVVVQTQQGSYSGRIVKR